MKPSKISLPSYRYMRDIPEYMIWIRMKQRCYQPNDTSYPRYGGRGITVHSRWLESFWNFYADMGPRSSPAHSLERNDNNAPYSAENCRWATAKEQARNRRNSVYVTIRGVRMLFIEAVEKYGVPDNRARIRMARLGWTAEEAFQVDAVLCAGTGT